MENGVPIDMQDKGGDQVWWRWAPTQIGPSLDHLEQVRVADFHGTSHVPGHVNHGHNGFDVLHLVPLISFQGQLVLIGCRPEGVTTRFSNPLAPSFTAGCLPRSPPQASTPQN